MGAKRILVVEDDPAILALEERLLRHAGFEVRGAPGSSEALALAAEEEFDLFVLDVMLPGMSGYELARALAARDPARQVPLVFATANQAADGVREGFRTGAALYLVKPFQTATLLSTVRAAMGS